jgi:N-methylhydantoinase A
VRLDREAAASAMRTQLGGDPVELAAGIYALANASMAAALRTVTLERGIDARGLPMIVGGGAGPIHAAAIASELDVQVILVPRTSSTFCALGTLFLDLRHEYVRSCFGRLDSVDPRRVAALVADMEGAGRQTLISENAASDCIRFAYGADLRYSGQFRDVTVSFGREELESGPHSLWDRFQARHEELYGYAVSELPVDLVNLRVTAIAASAKPMLPRVVDARDQGAEDAFKGRRLAYLSDVGEYVSMAVYDGEQLCYGHRLTSPALIELPNSTVVVLPPYEVLVDKWGTFTLFHPGVEDEVRRRVTHSS